MEGGNILFLLVQVQRACALPTASARSNDVRATRPEKAIPTLFSQSNNVAMETHHVFSPMTQADSEAKVEDEMAVRDVSAYV